MPFDRYIDNDVERRIRSADQDALEELQTLIRLRCSAAEDIVLASGWPPEVCRWVDDCSYRQRLVIDFDLNEEACTWTGVEVFEIVVRASEQGKLAVDSRWLRDVPPMPGT